jgi:hypothetical protein
LLFHRGRGLPPTPLSIAIVKKVDNREGEEEPSVTVFKEEADPSSSVATSKEVDNRERKESPPPLITTTKGRKRRMVLFS